MQRRLQGLSTGRVWGVCLWLVIYSREYADGRPSGDNDVSVPPPIRYDLPPPCDKQSSCNGDLCLCTTVGSCVGYYNGQMSTSEVSANQTFENGRKRLYASAFETAYQDQLGLGFNLLALTTLPAIDSTGATAKVLRTWELDLEVQQCTSKSRSIISSQRCKSLLIHNKR
eukprot:1184021-Prorocentrum_minimum.AAC.2